MNLFPKLNHERIQQILQFLIGAEQIGIPIFVHNPQTQQIAGVVIVTEQVVAQLFGLGGAQPVNVPVDPPAVPAGVPQVASPFVASPLSR